MGVAQWLLREFSYLSSFSILIVEMGAYAKGEIALMCSFVQPTIAVMTPLGSDHLALFGSEEAIVEANEELIEALPKDGKAFLATSVEQPSDIHEDNSGLQFSILNSQFSISLHGLHNANNAALAIAVAKELGISEKRIQELLKTFHPLLHTFNVREERGITLVDDTYNSSRLSMRAALDWVGVRTERPRVMLTSGLMEVGLAEDRFMEELGTHARGKLERVVFTTDRGMQAFADAFDGPVELLNAKTNKVAASSLLLAIGRMPLSSIQRLLPSES
jgi:UDP-N-acetylmuramoyl-tripeptide--D-alanyl-D-alanine ligase